MLLDIFDPGPCHPLRELREAGNISATQRGEEMNRPAANMVTQSRQAEKQLPPSEIDEARRSRIGKT